MAAILDLCTTATSILKNNAGNEFLVVNLVRKVVLYIFLGQNVKKVIFPLWLLAAILKKVNNQNCPRVTPPHPPESSNRGSGQQYSAKEKNYILQVQVYHHGCRNNRPNNNNKGLICLLTYSKYKRHIINIEKTYHKCNVQMIQKLGYM